MRSRAARATLPESIVCKGVSVQIGEPQRTYAVEPLEDPVPREEPAEEERAKTATEMPREPEKVSV